MIEKAIHFFSLPNFIRLYQAKDAVFRHIDKRRSEIFYAFFTAKKYAVSLQSFVFLNHIIFLFHMLLLLPLFTC